MSNIRQEVIAWNDRFPLDRWWRKRNKIPFHSPAHRESTFYGQLFEYYEEVLIKEYSEKVNKDKNNTSPKYSPLSGEWWNGISSSLDEINDWFSGSL